MAAMVVSIVEELGIMYAGSPEAAMNELEKIFIETPLASYLEMPEVAQIVSKHATPFFALGGMMIYATRCSMIRKKVQAEKKLANKMNGTGTLEYTDDGNSDKVGKVDSSAFYKDDGNGLNAQRSWFQASTNNSNNQTSSNSTVSDSPSAAVITKPLYEE